MVDLNIDNLTKKIIKEICDNPPNFEEITKKGFYRNLRLIIQNYGVVFVLDEIEKVIYDLSNETWNGKTFEEVIKETEKEVEEETEKPKKIILSNNIKSIINKNLKISKVAKDYGIKIKKNKAICPFHDDKEPSLSISDEKNIFHCFGCGAKGDIMKFIELLEETKQNGEKRC